MQWLRWHVYHWSLSFKEQKSKLLQHILFRQVSSWHLYHAAFVFSACLKHVWGSTYTCFRWAEISVKREQCNIKFKKDAIQLGWVWYNNHEQDIQFPVPASTSESSSIFLIQFKRGIQTWYILDWYIPSISKILSFEFKFYDNHIKICIPSKLDYSIYSWINWTISFILF